MIERPQRVSAYSNDISNMKSLEVKIEEKIEPEIIIDDVKSKKKGKKKKESEIEQVTQEPEPSQVTPVIPESKITEAPVLSVSHDTTEFNKFLETLKLYISYQPRGIDVDVILQMHLNVYRLENNFNDLLEDLQKNLKVPKEQAIIELIKVYFDWTTGKMMAKIQEHPKDKYYYDSVISIIGKHTDKS